MPVTFFCSSRVTAQFKLTCIPTGEPNLYSFVTGVTSAINIIMLKLGHMTCCSCTHSLVTIIARICRSSSFERFTVLNHCFGFLKNALLHAEIPIGEGSIDSDIYWFYNLKSLNKGTLLTRCLGVFLF